MRSAATQLRLDMFAAYSWQMRSPLSLLWTIGVHVRERGNAWATWCTELGA